MITQYYRTLVRVLGLVIAVCSGISASILWAAPPPDGLSNIDPVTLKNTVVIILVALGVAAPLAAAFVPAPRWLTGKAAVFAVAGFSNAMALSPELTVPFQDTTSIVAVVCGLTLAVLSILAFLDAVQKKNPQSKF